MKYIKQVKSIGIICALCAFVLGSVFVFAPVKQVDAQDTVILAKGGKKSDSKKDKPSKKPSSKKKSDKAPSGGKKSNNSYAKKSLSGDCKKVAGKCVTFSKSGCGNFYIKGRHYGGSQSCRILKKNCSRPNTVVTRTPVRRTINVNSTATTTKQFATSTLERECTPGVDCPIDELGPVLRHCVVTPAFAGKNTNTCPFFWVAGNQTEDSNIKCKLVTPNGSEVDVPTEPLTNGYENGYPIPTGKSTLVCVRTTKVVEDGVERSEVVNQDHVVECKPNPAVREI